MTWSRFDDAASTHPKARLAGNEAWALWVGAVMYCNRYLTDGFVPWAALATECLPEPVTPAKAKKLAQRAIDAKIRQGGPGLFVLVEGGVMVHDFLEWNPCKADVESKRKADRDRKRGPKGSAPDSSETPERIPRGIQHGTRTDSVTHTIPAQPAQPEKENPPTPKPRDRFAQSFVAPARGRPDVLELFELWKTTFGFREAVLGLGVYNTDAETLAGAIDALTIETCKLVLKHAPSDPMVAGRSDENKQPHESIGYIFGNQNALNRILRAARDAERNQPGNAVDDIRRRKEARV
jgi:hypothetical protein